VHIEEHRTTFESVRGGTLGFRPAGGGRPALRARSSPWSGAPTGDERPRRRRTRAPRYRRSAQTAGAHGALIRALRARIGTSWRLLASESWPWSSGLFVGERHRFVCEAAAETLDGLPEWAFVIAHHYVADVALIGREGAQVTIEALTVVEV
jgi:hypothetical protein